MGTTALHNCVDQQAVIRPGHQPFKRTIGDALSQLACRSEDDAWVRDSLEQMRFDRPERNHAHGGACENCGKEASLVPVKFYESTDMVTFNLCRSCR